MRHSLLSPRAFRRSTILAVWFALLAASRAEADEPLPSSAPTTPTVAPPALPPADPIAPPEPDPPSVAPPSTNVAPPSDAEEPIPEPMSEGRAIVVAWNTGFQWGLAPGVVFSEGRAGFSLGVRLGWGFDTGSVILVPGVRLSATFLDPNVYVGMPAMKLVYPINRFAPFVEAGAGLGHIAGGTSATGAALFAGGGFMIHFTHSFALGAEVNYQVITGTGFKGLGIGPIIAFAF